MILVMGIPLAAETEATYYTEIRREFKCDPEVGTMAVPLALEKSRCTQSSAKTDQMVFADSRLLLT